MEDKYIKLVNLLKKDDRLLSTDNTLLKNEVVNLSNHMDEKLIKILLSDDDIKEMFFKKVDNIMIFDKQKFNWVINSKEFLPDSYTIFSNKIGLIDQNKMFIKNSDDVVLAFPNKDCFLEFDSTEEEENRKEIFFNETLSKSEIDVLKDNKVFINAKKHTADGVNSIDLFDKNDNLIIKGNNLLAMYSLLPRFKNQVKLMYWDILYNRDSDHVPYSDSFRHSSWLTMMKNRLEVAQKLLRKDGIICLQCDDHEMYYLKVLCDEIFGRDNFITNFLVQVRYSDKSLNEKADFQPVFEYLLVYKATDEKATIYRPTIDYSLNKFVYEIKELGEGETFEKNGRKVTVFKKGEWELIEHKEASMDLLKETWITGTIYSGTGHGLMWQNVVEPRIKEDGYGSLYKIDGLGDDGLGYRYYTGPQKSNARYGKMFTGVPLSRQNDIKNGKSSKKELTIVNYLNISPDLGNCRQEGGVELQGGKKPEIYLQYLLNIFTKEDDIVLDAYLGTGTTAAVAHKMGRKYIGIEQLDKHMDKVLKILHSVIEGEQSGISKNVNWNVGGSFVSLELAKNNYNMIEKIAKAKDEDLNSLYEEIINFKFINYRVDKELLQKEEKNFENLENEDKRKVLLKLLDKNLLYVNYNEIDDSDYDISESDKKYNKSYYEE